MCAYYMYTGDRRVLRAQYSLTRVTDAKAKLLYQLFQRLFTPCKNELRAGNKRNV